MILKRIYEKTRNNEIKLSSEITDFDLLPFYLYKLSSLFRGWLKTGKSKCFIGKHCSIRVLKKIRFGIFFNLSDNVFLDGLSSNGLTFGNYVSIGKNTRIEGSGSYSYLGKGFKCGNNCGLGTDCFYGCAGGIEIGNDVIVGNYVSFHSENHNYHNANVPIRLQGTNHKGIVIGDDCWIGAKSTILDGAIIGKGCIVAAGAVVTGAFPDYSIIAGVPAKIIKKRK